MSEPLRMRVLVADDEPLARRRLVALLERRADVGPIAQAGDGAAAIAQLAAGGFDLAFLDVQMPGPDGLAVARAIGPDRAPAVVFVTAFDQYAVAAFELAAVDYLLKPFDDERFTDAVERARRRIAGEGLADFRARLDAMLSAPSTPAPSVITVEKAGRLVVLPLADVDWIGAAGNYVEVHARGDAYLVRTTLTRALERLAPPAFLRTHRGIVVNAERIAHITPGARGEHHVVLRDGTRLPLSRRWRRRLPTLAG